MPDVDVMYVLIASCGCMGEVKFSTVDSIKFTDCGLGRIKTAGFVDIRQLMYSLFISDRWGGG